MQNGRGCDFLLRLNGNMHVGQSPAPGIIQVIRKETLIVLVGMIKTQAMNFILWVKRNQTGSGYMICTEMSGSGLKMTGIAIIKVRLKTGKLG